MLDKDRELLLANDVERISARPEILQSWRRCQLSGVSPDRLNLTCDPPPGESRFRRTVAPVLDAAAQRMAGTDSALLLTDRAGRLIWRWSDQSELRFKLDSKEVVEGTVWDEASVGTGGIGTALETAAMLTVSGTEHYVEDLHPFTCVAAPVRHPITRRVEGVLNLTCQTKHASPLMRPVLARLVADVESELFGDSTARERELYHHFLAERRRSHAAVFAVNDKLLIANTAGARLKLDHHSWWARAEQLLETGSKVVVESEDDGQRVELRQVAKDGVPVGFVIVVEEAPAERAGAGDRAAINVPSSTTDAGLRRSGSSADRISLRGPRWHDIIAWATRAVATGDPLLVTGEVGAGKLTLIRQVVPQDRAIDVIDAASAHLGDPVAWLARVRRLLATRGSTLVLLHLDALDTSMLTALATLIDSSQPLAELALAATWTNVPEQPSAAQHALINRFGLAPVEVTPLRRRPEDLAEMLDKALAGDADDPRRLRISAAAHELLLRYRWPGNAREFDAFARWLRSQDFAVVDVKHLPPHLSREVLRRNLTQMEAAEADLIVSALAQTGGNKVAAAELLGMSRSSLYRKMRIYRLDG